MRTITLLSSCAALLVLGALPITARAAATVPAAPAPDVAADYRLSQGDQLEISVLGHDDLKATVTILPDGTISFPIAGHLHAAGLTVDQLDAALVRGLSSQLNQPQVNVSIQQTQVLKVSVLGAVKQPGLMDYKPGWRVLDALAAAGGPSQDAVQTLITVVQANGQLSVPVNAEPLLSGTDLSHNIPLSAGDVLLVQERDPSEAQVQVIGAVEKPGVYPAPAAGASVISLIAQAGGTTPTAGMTRVQIVHEGNTKVVDLRALENSSSADGAAARVVPGDVLMVPENTALVQVLGEVKNPGIYSIPDGASAPITTIIASMGGLTENADKKMVYVMHPENGGLGTKETYNLASMLTGDTAPVSIRPGDLLVVQTRHKGYSALEILDGLNPLVYFTKR